MENALSRNEMDKIKANFCPQWIQGSQVQCWPRAIKICSMPSFRGKVKRKAPCRKILQHVKNPFKL
jgi:hypothetical protein